MTPVGFFSPAGVVFTDDFGVFRRRPMRRRAREFQEPASHDEQKEERENVQARGEAEGQGYRPCSS
jgi:hypothetical protein